MHVADLPHFKDAVVMGFHCDRCGYKTNEVKAVGAVSDKGRRYIVHVNAAEDLSRDILKSETAAVLIPEIELELTPGTLGGRFTTIEGLLQQIKLNLTETAFMSGDSFNARLTTDEQQRKNNFLEFVNKLDEIIELKRPFTVILDDPLGNSYVQNLCAPDVDPSLQVQEYERTAEQNAEFGLDSIHTTDQPAADSTTDQH